MLLGCDWQNAGTGRGVIGPAGKCELHLRFFP